MEFPGMVKVTQHFDTAHIQDPAAAVQAELERIDIGRLFRPGARIAITAGSRGIRNNVAMLRSVVETVRMHGGEPFIIGAMGSHGGGTAEGQMEVLHSLGITPESMGCLVLTSAETVHIGQTPDGLEVYCDVDAYNADGIIILNRVKPHTSFRGINESGLAKMIAIGLGKAPGATQCHRLGPGGMGQGILSVARVMREKAPILCGVAVVENSFDETARIVALLPHEMEQREAELLVEAKNYLPRIPVQGIDLLIVEQMGKNFSGTGMDTNVIGRMRIHGLPEPELPGVKRIAVLDLTEASHGNATGIGLADVATARLEAKVDRHATYLNCITSTYIQRAFLPIVAPTDHEAVTLALRSLGLREGESPRIVRIKNTLHLETLWVSESMRGEAAGRPLLTVAPGAQPMEFDESGSLLPGC